MSYIIEFGKVEEKILEIRGQKVIVDRDVATLYGVETREVNQAVSRNPDKFPEGYIIALESDEWESLRSQFVTLEGSGRGQHTKYLPSAFTEKGLYMLATILKSPAATQTTIAIVEAFANLRELSRVMSQLPEAEDEAQQKSLMQRSGDILADILDSGTFDVTGDETTIEMNLAFVKVKRTIKREKRQGQDTESGA